MGDLEPVYDLFTIACEIPLSESVSHVIYRGTDIMNLQMRKKPYGVLKRTEPQRKYQHKNAPGIFFFFLIIP